MRSIIAILHIFGQSNKKCNILHFVDGTSGQQEQANGREHVCAAGGQVQPADAAEHHRQPDRRAQKDQQQQDGERQVSDCEQGEWDDPPE